MSVFKVGDKIKHVYYQKDNGCEITTVRHGEVVNCMADEHYVVALANFGEIVKEMRRGEELLFDSPH